MAFNQACWNSPEQGIFARKNFRTKLERPPIRGALRRLRQIREISRQLPSRYQQYTSWEVKPNNFQSY